MPAAVTDFLRSVTSMDKEIGRLLQYLFTSATLDGTTNASCMRNRFECRFDLTPQLLMQDNDPVRVIRFSKLNSAAIKTIIQ